MILLKCGSWSCHVNVLRVSRTKQWMQDDEWQKALLFLPGSVAETAASSGLVPEGFSGCFGVHHAALASYLLVSAA